MTVQDPNDKKNITGGVFAPSTDQFQVRSATSGVTYCFTDVPPVQGAYVGVDDKLMVTAFSNIGQNQLIINVRMLGLDGLIHPLKFAFTPTSARVATVFTFQLMEGWILSAACEFLNGQSNIFYTYTIVGLARAPFATADVYDVLMAGYVNNATILSYPNSIMQRPTDGAGVLTLIAQGAPAAGADFNIPVPAGVRWQLLTFRATLTTAVAVANRTVTLQALSGANSYMESDSNFTQAASLVNTYNFWNGAQIINVPFNLRTTAPIPNTLYLRAGDTIQTVTGAIQAADQWSGAFLEVVEWQDNV
jgi:hypothetical protein